MPLPSTPRLTVYNSIISTLRGVSAGAEYALGVTKVTTRSTPVEAVKTTDWPMWVVLGGAGSESPKGASRRNASLVSVTCLGYVGADPARWPGKESADLAELMLADATKALNLDPTRGDATGSIWAPEEDFRDLDMVHDPEGRFSVVFLTDTYAYITLT